MADDSDIQQLPDLNRRSLTGSGAAAERAAEHDDEQDATEQDTGDQEERRRYKIAWDELKRWFHNGWSLRAQISAQARDKNAVRMSARRS
jgi:hypothetical protein